MDATHRWLGPPLYELNTPVAPHTFVRVLNVASLKGHRGRRASAGGIRFRKIRVLIEESEVTEKEPLSVKLPLEPLAAVPGEFMKIEWEEKHKWGW